VSRPIVLSHWHKLFESFFTSPQEFYTAVERTLDEWGVKDITTSRVTWAEGSALSAKRVYLRVNRGICNFDICAAPYGAGFFFSYWLTVAPPFLYALLALLGLITLTIGALFLAFKSGCGGGLLVLLGFAGLLAFLGFLVRDGGFIDEEVVLAMPFVGSLYERIYGPATFYELDTTTMFSEAVHHALLKTIETVTSGQGLRLSELERQPKFRTRGRYALLPLE
jgi:hypothetical protein